MLTRSGGSQTSVPGDKTPNAYKPGTTKSPAKNAKPSVTPGLKPPPSQNISHSVDASIRPSSPRASQYHTQYNFNQAVPNIDTTHPDYMMPVDPLPQIMSISLLTKDTVMHHILFDMLGEKMIIGPIRSAIAAAGITKPHHLIQKDCRELVTRRSIDGQLMQYPTYLSQRQVDLLENLQSYHNEVLMKDVFSQQEHLPYETWMKATHTDLMHHLSRRRAAKAQEGTNSAMAITIEDESMDTELENMEVEHEHSEVEHEYNEVQHVNHADDRPIHR